MTGTFTGTFTETATQVTHPDGTTTAHGFGIFTGQAGPCGTGSFDFQVGVHGTVTQLMGRFASIDQSRALPIRLLIAGVNGFAECPATRGGKTPAVLGNGASSARGTGELAFDSHEEAEIIRIRL